MSDITHDHLVEKGGAYLRKRGCGIVIKELKSQAWEIPDVVGWIWETCVLIECKTSRADFLADQKKGFRLRPEFGVGNHRFYLCPEGVIAPEDLPESWGLLYLSGRSIIEVCDIPKSLHAKGAFTSSQSAERRLLLSAIRRMSTNPKYIAAKMEVEGERESDRITALQTDLEAHKEALRVVDCPHGCKDGRLPIAAEAGAVCFGCQAETDHEGLDGWYIGHWDGEGQYACPNCKDAAIWDGSPLFKPCDWTGHGENR